MNLLGRIAALGAFSLVALAGWGNTAHTRNAAWGLPAAAVRWPGGSQTLEKIHLAGAGNETLSLFISVEGNHPDLQARTEGLPLGVACQFFRVIAAPPGSAANFPPDALVPLNENAPGSITGPLQLWVSLKVGPACAPGNYSGNLIFTNGQWNLRLPIALKVYRFSLPKDLPISIFGGFWLQSDFWNRYLKGSPSEGTAIVKKYYASLRDHKFNALGGSYPLPLGQLQAGQRIEDFSAYHDLLKYALEDLQFKYFQIPKISDWESISSANGSYPQQARNFYTLYGEYLRRHGWENRALNYLVDEPIPQQYEAVIQSFTLAKSLSSGIRTLSAGKHSPPGSARAIDIWAYQAGSYREDERQQAERQGQEAWLYINRLQGIDHPLMHQRLIGWLLYRYQFSGYLLWGVNFWPHDPWTNPPGSKDSFRRGTFYYPNPHTGLPVPTTRLEALRRGFEDYQYLLLLDQACRRNLVPREKQELISAKLRHLTDNLPRSTFPVSMDELEEMRLNIGEILDGVNGSEEAQENPPAAQPQAHIRQEEAAR